MLNQRTDTKIMVEQFCKLARYYNQGCFEVEDVAIRFGNINQISDSDILK